MSGNDSNPEYQHVEKLTFRLGESDIKFALSRKGETATVGVELNKRLSLEKQADNLR